MRRESRMRRQMSRSSALESVRAVFGADRVRVAMEGKIVFGAAGW
jgi:hypothetical protein